MLGSWGTENGNYYLRRKVSGFPTLDIPFGGSL